MAANHRHVSAIGRSAMGKAFWRIKFSDVPPAENPTFLVEVTNEYMTEILL